jgi:hypothetical protein
MSLQDNDVPATPKPGTHEKLLFWACFIALVATAFAFIIRVLIIDEWGRDFRLTDVHGKIAKGIIV